MPKIGKTKSISRTTTTGSKTLNTSKNIPDKSKNIPDKSKNIPSKIVKDSPSELFNKINENKTSDKLRPSKMSEVIDENIKNYKKKKDDMVEQKLTDSIDKRKNSIIEKEKQIEALKKENNPVNEQKIKELQNSIETDKQKIQSREEQLKNINEQKKNEEKEHLSDNRQANNNNDDNLQDTIHGNKKYNNNNNDDLQDTIHGNNNQPTSSMTPSSYYSSSPSTSSSGLSSNFSPFSSHRYNQLEDDNNDPDINENKARMGLFIKMCVNFLIPIGLLIIYIITLIIVILSIYNIIAFIIGAIYTFLRYKTEFIYQTLEHKLLNYVDLKLVDLGGLYSNNSQIFEYIKYDEPYNIKLYLITFFITLIFIIYFFIFLGIAISIILYGISSLLTSFNIGNFNFGNIHEYDPVTKRKIIVFQKFITFPNFAGLLFAILSLIFFVLFFTYAILPKLREIKASAIDLDNYITQLYQNIIGINSTFVNKLKDNKINEVINNIIDDLINKKLYGDVIIYSIILTLYKNIRDDIPDVNKDALEKLHEYFFDDNNNINNNKNIEITYISLNHIDKIGKLEIENPVYKNLNFYKNQKPEIFNNKFLFMNRTENLYTHLDLIMNDINEKIKKYNDDNQNTIRIYYFVFLIIFAYLISIMFIFNTGIIIKYVTDSNMRIMASWALGILVSFPGDIGYTFANLLFKALHFEEYTSCVTIASQENTSEGRTAIYKQCIKNILSSSNTIENPEISQETSPEIASDI